MPNFRRPSTPVRALVRLSVAVAAVAAISACKSLTEVAASFDNITDSTTFFALNSSPPGAASALDLFNVISFRANSGFLYDVAFDIDASGKAVIIPAKALATVYAAGSGTPYSVGLQVVQGATFLSLTDAPKSGYRLDTALAVVPGEVVAIESHDINHCSFAIKGQSFFSKMVITGVDLTNRIVSVKLTVNKNCGFRSFADGKPND